MLLTADLLTGSVRCEPGAVAVRRSAYALTSERNPVPSPVMSSGGSTEAEPRLSLSLGEGLDRVFMGSFLAITVCHMANRSGHLATRQGG